MVSLAGLFASTSRKIFSAPAASRLFSVVSPAVGGVESTAQRLVTAAAGAAPCAMVFTPEIARPSKPDKRPAATLPVCTIALVLDLWLAASYRFRPQMQPLFHHAHRLRARVHHHKAPPMLRRRRTRRPAAGEKVQHQVIRVGMHAHNPLQNPQRLLRGVARLLLAGG